MRTKQAANENAARRALAQIRKRGYAEPWQASRLSYLAKTRYSSTAKLFLPVAFASYIARSARWMRAFASKLSTFSW